MCHTVALKFCHTELKLLIARNNLGFKLIFSVWKTIIFMSRSLNVMVPSKTLNVLKRMIIYLFFVLKFIVYSHTFTMR